MVSTYLRRFRPVIVGVSALVLALTTVLSAAAAPPPWAGKHVCGVGPASTARCHAIVRTDLGPLAAPAGYGPADLQSAYKLPSGTAGSGKTIAIVDAFDNPNAEADLAVYRSTFGLSACTTANGCFRKVDQRGGTSYPA